MALISKSKFLGYQNRFHGKVKQSPMVVELRLVTDIEPEDDYERFTGDSDRATKSFKIPCLYKREIKSEERDKYGWSKDVDGVFYFSPLDLIKAFGTFKIDTKKTTLIFSDTVQEIEKIDYLEPYYDTCVTVTMATKSITGTIQPLSVLAKTLQVINFNLPDFTPFADGSLTFTPTSNGSVPIIILSSNISVAIIQKTGNNFTITFVQPGKVTFTAMQLENENFASAVPVIQALEITA